MKSPDHPRPSGDRRIARLLIKAMGEKGHTVEVMSALRAWEGFGDLSTQRQIARHAKANAKQIISDIKLRPAKQQPDIWFSYHLYHKAPDWLGPSVAAQLQIPYVVAEASYAAKQAAGPWSAGLAQTEKALRQASAIICLNPRDTPGLKQLGNCEAKIHQIPPFLDLEEIKPPGRSAARREAAKRFDLNPELPWLISVAMMRNDAKLKSYRLLAKALKMNKQAFQVLLVGDGGARHEVERLFAGSLKPHTRFAGQLDQPSTLQALIASDVFVWPAVNEAIGMAALEAQACGLAAVVGDSGAMSTIVSNQVTGFVCAPEDSQKMANCIDQLLSDKTLREQYSLAAMDKVKTSHSLNAAAQTLDQILRNLPALPG